MSLNLIPGRIGLTARQGKRPRRWWCALRGHDWLPHEGWARVKVADGPWRMLKDGHPVMCCGRCEAQLPWESEFAEPDFLLDSVLVTRL